MTILELLRSHNPVLALETARTAEPALVQALVAHAVAEGLLTLPAAARPPLLTLGYPATLLETIPEPSPWLPVGVAQAVVVAGAHGLVCRLRVAPGEPTVPTEYPPGELGQSLRAGAEAAERWLCASTSRRTPAVGPARLGLRWTVELPIPDAELHGHSCALAAALAWLSWACQEPVAVTCFGTGQLRPATGAVLAVEELAAKRNAVRREGGPAAWLLEPGSVQTLTDAVVRAFSPEFLERLRWQADLGVTRWLAISCGTSLWTNYSRGLSEPERKLPEATMQRLRQRRWDAPPDPGEAELLAALAAWPRTEGHLSDGALLRSSAELSTLLHLRPPVTPADRIWLLASDTGDGRLTALALQQHCQERFLAPTELEAIPGLCMLDQGETFRTIGLPGLVRRLGSLIRQAEADPADPEVLLVATGGFKPFHSFMMLTGMLFRVPVVYQAEDRELLRFPPLELQWSRELWKRNRELLVRLAAGEPLAAAALAEQVAREGDADLLQPVLEPAPTGPAGGARVRLSPQGLAFHEANLLAAHRRDPRERLLFLRTHLEERLRETEGTEQAPGLLLLDAELANEEEGGELARFVRLARRLGREQLGTPPELFRFRGTILATLVPPDQAHALNDWLDRLTTLHARLRPGRHLTHQRWPPRPTDPLLAEAAAWAATDRSGERAARSSI